jgi:hypothetical protein
MVVTNTSGAGTLIAGRTNEGGPNVFRVDSNGKGYFNGGTSVGGADFAETFAVKADAVAYEPGDVMAIDATGSRRLVRSSSAYSRAVAGVYSTKPGVVAAPVAVANQTSDGIPLAVVGVVPCKVSAENGSITPGDLLVTSSQPGYAMKGTDASKMTGAIVGKALQPWSSGKGVIEILVTLQ